MKNQILFFAVSAICASSALMLSASPAMAKGARFEFAPQEYLLEEPIRGPRSSYRPNRRHAPSTSVMHGSVPNASTMFGFNPAFLAPAQNSTVNSRISKAPVAPPHFQPSPNNWVPTVAPQQFGQPPQQPHLTMPVSKPRQAVTSPRVSGKMTTPRSRVAHFNTAPHSHRAPRIKTPPPKRIAKYGDNLYTAGETKPKASNFNATQEVQGRVLTPRPR